MKRLTLVTGEKGSGKSAFILSRYRGKTGYVTRKSDVRGSVLYLVDLESGEEEELMRRTVEGPYIVRKEVFERANSRLVSIHTGLMVLDECGWMETHRRGFFPALEHIRKEEGISAVLSVRLDCLDWYLDFFSPEECSLVRL